MIKPPTWVLGACACAALAAAAWLLLASVPTPETPDAMLPPALDAPGPAAQPAEAMRIEGADEGAAVAGEAIANADASPEADESPLSAEAARRAAVLEDRKHRRAKSLERRLERETLREARRAERKAKR
ncbi:MAG: hypothetical protein QNJ98_20225 [Planctomycetota bacterium]|nr:hypothetical protein [Planctomycetota bacterium]